jgi:hypothetical protein
MGRYGSKECFNFIPEIERQGKKRQSKGKRRQSKGKRRQSKGKRRQSLCPHTRGGPSAIQFYPKNRMAFVKAFAALCRPLPLLCLPFAALCPKAKYIFTARIRKKN